MNGGQFDMDESQSVFSGGATFPISSGIVCLCVAASAHQIRADAAQISQAHGFTERVVGAQEILLAAKSLNLKARSTSTNWSRLSKIALPSIAELRSGEYVVIVQFNGAQVTVFDPKHPQKPTFFDQTRFEAEWSGRVILVRNSLQLPIIDRKFGLSWFVPVGVKYRKILLEVLVATFVIQLFGLATPLFSQVIIDKVLMHKSLSTLHVLGVGMLIIISFEAILSMLQTHLMAHTANRIDVVLGARVVNHLMRLPLRYFELRRVGNTVAHVRELENIRQFITGSSIGSVLDLLFIAIFIAVMLFYSTTLSLVVLAMLPFFIGISLAMRPLMRIRLEEKFNRGAESQSYLVEAVTGIHTIKALAVEPIMQQKWETILARYVTASFRAAHLSGIGGALSQIIQRISTLAILWVGAELVMKGELSVGQLIAFQMLSGRVIQPIVRVVQLWQDFQQIGLSVERLGDIMDTPPELLVNPSQSFPPAVNGSVHFENVFFRYLSDGHSILNGLSFKAEPGQTIGIVGRSGSGKSTLAKLLQRLYLPESGSITIDNIKIQQIDPARLRRQIGVVLQENFLFDGSIRENIALQLPGASLQAIIHVAQLAGAHDFIMALPDGYETPTGERGVSLSGGQRQRIAIARALLANPRILIFDEATSALDYESERIIQDNLIKICEGRTVFMIAHRLSTIRNADHILVMDHGAVVEQGTHADLMMRKGLYHHLFSQQEPHIHAVQTA
jgi:subfamily B ATP-binding cassette protein HlyB/CyaB